MWVFEESRDIQASPATVMGLILNTGDYPRWNPFIISARGRPALGEVISGKARLGHLGVPYRHRIYELEAGRSLRWHDFGPSALLACSDRQRRLRPIPGGTRYECRLRISGPLSGLVKLLFGNGLRTGIISEARALKAEAEALAGDHAPSSAGR